MQGDILPDTLVLLVPAEEQAVVFANLVVRKKG